MNSTFYTGTIDRDEFERLIVDVIARDMPDAIVYSISYTDRGLEIKTDRGEIRIEIDWEEITIKENNEPTIIE
jgi:hypothetical protein